MGYRVNLGCGRRPTPDWVNLDNATITLIARTPARSVVRPLLPKRWRDYMDVIARHRVQFANAKRLPFPDRSVEALYTSHMLEHLDRPAALDFLKEVRRVLEPDGAIRISVPDLAILVRDYQQDGDADRFIERTLMAYDGPQGTAAKLRRWLRGFREHRWMYDAASLSKLLGEAGFTRITVLKPGETTLPNPGVLDLRERAGGSVFIEARA